MSGFKVTALYDFTGEPGTAELSIQAGEILTVTRSDVGEGWWEGTNSSGKSGLFPAAYVETISTSGPPDRPPPMLPPEVIQESWGDSGNMISNDADPWDDEWDEDTYSEIGPGQQPQQQMYANENIGVAPTAPLPALPYQGDGDSVSNFGSEGNKGPMAKKNLNRFSTFAKSGIEGYIAGDLKVQVSEADKIYISLMDQIVSWPTINRHYTVQVASPKKESKLKGLKSFIAYQLTPSFNNIQVSRRYKHFDWLHERLSEKFILIPIPPLPDKQISNRYDEQFIEHRRVQLQAFVDWVCRHPVLSICEVWQHFLTCTDEKRWKQGKRQAEKDTLVGANFCVLLEAPEKLLLPSVLEPQIDRCVHFIHSLDNSLKNLMATTIEQTKKCQGPYKREYQKIGESFYALGGSLELGEDNSIYPPSNLTEAIKRTGSTYIEISKMFEDQPKFDWEPLGDRLHLYKGITSGFPDVLSAHRVAMNKRKECEKLTSDQKMNVAELNDVTRKTDVINYAILAEINHFRRERNIDMRVTMKHFLQQQIEFYQNIVRKLQGTLELYEE